MLNPSLNILFQILLKTYFSSSHCILIFTDQFSQIQVKTTIPLVYLVVHDGTLNPKLIFNHYGCQDIIITHHNATTIFTDFEKLIRIKNERFNDRKYLVHGGNAINIFKSKEIQYVCNILLILNGTNHYELVTNKYENSEKIKLLDIWFPNNKTFKFGFHLFPDKLKNQNGRNFQIGTFTYEPYSIAENQTFEGTETNFIFEFVHKYNLTSNFTLIDDYWGEIYNNWTGTGVLGSVLHDEIDIGFGSVYTWEEYYRYLDYSKPLTRSGITCIVPSPKEAAGWFTPLYSFSLEMWMGLFLVLVLETVIVSILLFQNHQRKYFQSTILLVIELHLLQPLTITLKGKILKYFIAFNMLAVLLLTSAYSSGLSSVMTVPRYEKAIKTVQDLASSGLKWGANTDAWLISLRHVKEEKYNIIKRNFVVKSEKGLVEASRLNNFGFTLERLPHGHYAIGPYIKGHIISNFRIMQEDIYWEQCIFIVRKNSVLLSLLDNLILRVFEAGLQSYWEFKVVAQYMDMVVQRGIEYYSHNVQEHGTVKLKWEHVEGAFAILTLGQLISISTFFYELFSKHNLT